MANLKKGAVTLGIPYKPTKSEKTESLFIVYVDDNGNPQLLTKGVLEPQQPVHLRCRLERR